MNLIDQKSTQTEISNKLRQIIIYLTKLRSNLEINRIIIVFHRQVPEITYKAIF